MPILHYLHQLQNCAKHRSIVSTKQLHAHFIRLGVTQFLALSNTLLNVYGKCSLLQDALQLFDEMPQRDHVSWATFLTTQNQANLPDKTLSMFPAMFSLDRLLPDDFVFASLVKACGSLGAIKQGKQVHGLVIQLGYESCMFISNAFVDMYAKCSDMSAARDVFSRMSRRDVVSWTSIIVGAAQHGQAEEALSLYDNMILNGVKPNEVTFVGLIYACSHVGLVNRGRELFKSMVEDYGIHPSLQHYTCLLDLLGRSGHLEEAESVINLMPFKPDEPTWAALLSACKQYRNAKMVIKFADHLFSLKPEEPSTYILLSNTYASSGLWEHASKARQLLESLEVRKEPGYSYIYFGKESQMFYAGETSHPMKDKIFGLLNELDVEMRRRGYVPDTSYILHNTDHQEKERQLFWHSERLAIAYGLLKSVPGTVIRIVKNLRVCGDCHTVLKLISDIVQREIVVRDAKRYHHFKGGKCSCNDFW
ncbi:hypothetical protein V6Z12_D02G027000 [Gossypium hirsutum]